VADKYSFCRTPRHNPTTGTSRDQTQKLGPRTLRVIMNR
jgi:hypothetical protein